MQIPSSSIGDLEEAIALALGQVEALACRIESRYQVTLLPSEGSHHFLRMWRRRYFLLKD